MKATIQPTRLNPRTIQRLLLVSDLQSHFQDGKPTWVNDGPYDLDLDFRQANKIQNVKHDFTRRS